MTGYFIRKYSYVIIKEVKRLFPPSFHFVPFLGASPVPSIYRATGLVNVRIISQFRFYFEYLCDSYHFSLFNASINTINYDSVSLSGILNVDLRFPSINCAGFYLNCWTAF